jgi:large subunit ribosomal protein L25
MAEAAVLSISERTGRGTKKAVKLRKEGRVPGVLYGHKEQTASVSAGHEEMVDAIRHGARVVDLQQEGAAVQKAQIMEVQWDHLGKDVLHVDFRRVAEGERITLSVTLELRGTPLGVTAGGVLEQPLHTIEIECPAVNVPDSIRVNIAELQIGGSIHVRDLTLPADVKALTDADAVVIQVTQPREEPAAPAAAEEAPTSAEPEIVGRRVAAEEGEAEK